jgi:hypothetical protein
MELNDKAPYRHWHTVCAACGKVTLARPCSVPGEIKAVEHNPVVKCQHCEDTRQYLTTDCFLAPLSAAATADKSAGALSLVAGLIAAADSQIAQRMWVNRQSRWNLLPNSFIWHSADFNGATPVPSCKPTFRSKWREQTRAARPLFALLPHGWRGLEIRV